MQQGNTCVLRTKEKERPLRNDDTDDIIKRQQGQLFATCRLPSEEGTKSNGQRKGEERAEEKRKLKVKEEGEF
ncbi:hypothetical protein NQZ68_005097 [Dissostichus eleginoides]|nr:hypothetical protein NQZ68_005097 [Dissostichus eleginoides]